jgi:hypothetical protein
MLIGNGGLSYADPFGDTGSMSSPEALASFVAQARPAVTLPSPTQLPFLLSPLVRPSVPPPAVDNILNDDRNMNDDRSLNVDKKLVWRKVQRR